MSQLVAADRPLRDRDLMDRVGLGHSQFYLRKRRGDFRFLELRPQLPDAATLYSASLVARWLAGEITAPRMFGRPPVTGEPRGPGRPRKSSLVSFPHVGHVAGGQR